MTWKEKCNFALSYTDRDQNVSGGVGVEDWLFQATTAYVLDNGLSFNFGYRGYLEGISEKIVHIDEVMSAISAAVEEQNASTQEIARNTTDAANGTRDVSSSIQDFVGIVKRSSSASEEVSLIVNGLSGQSSMLRERVEGFLRDVKTC